MAYYGIEWEVSVSKAKAEKYLNGKSLPRMGYETDLSVKRDVYGFVCRLVVMNVSGGFYVACCSVPRREWSEFFGFELDSVKVKH